MRVKKLNGVDEFACQIGYTKECNGDVVCNSTKVLTVFSNGAFI